MCRQNQLALSSKALFQYSLDIWILSIYTEFFQDNASTDIELIWHNFINCVSVNNTKKMPFRRDLAIKKIIYHCQSTRYYFVMLMKRSGKSKLDNILLSVTFFLGKLTLLSWLTVDLMKTGNYLTGDKLVSLLLKSTLMRFLFDSRLFFLIRIQFDNGLNWYWINLANLICIEKCYLIYIKIYNSTFRNESFSIYIFEKKPRTLYNL